MRVSFSKGKYGVFTNSGDAIDYLSEFNVQTITIEPEKITIRNEDNILFLVIFDGMLREFPIRRSFLEKLMKWYSFPVRQLDYFDIDTITSICNDYIINIKARYVNIKIEDGEALTITSDKFSEVGDIDLIASMENQGIETIYIDDYNTLIRIEEKYKIKPFTGDEFGVGMMISNSETGFSALRIQDFLLRYICSNGAYVKQTKTDLKFYHYNLFIRDVFDQINAMIENTEKRSKKIEERLKKMETPALREEVVMVNKEIMRATAIKMLNDVIESDRMLTRYELFNLITERAKEFRFGIRAKIESIAGSLV